MITEILLDATITCDLCRTTAPVKLPMLLEPGGHICAALAAMTLPSGWSCDPILGDSRTGLDHYCPEHAKKPPLVPVRVQLDFVMLCEGGIPAIDPLDFICDGALKAGAKEILPGGRLNMRRPAPAWLTKKAPTRKTRS